MIIHEIKADLARRGCREIIHLTQGDTGSQLIRFKITKNRKFWKPPIGLRALIHYSNSYGSGGTYDTLPDDTPAWCIVADDLCVTLVPQTMALPGSVHVVVTLLCGEEALSAIHLQLMVDGLASAASPVLANYSNITGFLPRPDSAEKGQIFAAEDVTESGKVLTVTATDLPSSDDSMDDSLIPTATVSGTAEGAKITITDKNGTTTATVSNGQDGITPHIGSNRNWFIGNADTGIASQGEKGDPGEAGTAGPQGPQGEKGPAGTDGKSAYQYAQEGGYSGTEEEFIQKLASMNYSYVAQPEAPENTNLLWFDTDDNSEDTTTGGSSPPADWKATEDEPGHILNRTHYETSEVILPETVVDFTDTDFGVISPAFEIVEDNLYLVTVNGETSECRPDTSTGMPALVGYSSEKQYGIVPGEYLGGDPTVMFMMWNGASVNPTTVSVKKTIVVKIPEKYLPESTVTKFVDCDLVYTGDLDGSANSAVARDNITVGTFIDWVKNGHNVVIRLFEENDGVTQVGLYPVTSYTLAPDAEQLNYMVTANTRQGAKQSYVMLMAGNDNLPDNLQFMYMEL